MRNQLDELNNATSSSNTSDSGLSSPSSDSALVLSSTSEFSTDSVTDGISMMTDAQPDRTSTSQSSYVSPDLLRIIEELSKSQGLTNVSLN